MKAIIVDDEFLALCKMEGLLHNFPEIQVMGTFQNPYHALEYLLQEEVDLAFLDIEMPGINGLILGEMLLRHQPDLHLVFVTAYDKYAVEAFEINALDYMLKPIQEERLAKTIKRIMVTRQQKKPVTLSQNAGRLCCFQNLSYQSNLTNHTQVIKWRTNKAQELFAYFLHHRGKAVRKEEIIELLWLGTSLEKANAHLHTTIYQIRRTIRQLGIDLTISYMDEGYCLQLGDVNLDVLEWEESVKQASEVSTKTLARHRELLELYRGDYLEEYAYLWAEGEQERLGLIWLEQIKKVARFYLQAQEYTEALLYYQKMQEKRPYYEEGYFGLMQVNALLGNHGEVKKQFDKLQQLYQADLGIAPRKEVLEWYAHWLTTI